MSTGGISPSNAVSFINQVIKDAALLAIIAKYGLMIRE